MKFVQNMNAIQKNEFNAGGNVHVPPALCLPPARASAHVPAYVERTGKAITKKLNAMGTARPVAVNGLILFLELTL
jgi:hypothetical protein